MSEGTVAVQEMRPAAEGRALIENSLVQLTMVRFREFWREPEAVFWVFVFPILLAGGLGIAFRNRPPEVVKIAAVGPQLAGVLRTARRLLSTRWIPHPENRHCAPGASCCSRSRRQMAASFTGTMTPTRMPVQRNFWWTVCYSAPLERGTPWQPPTILCASQVPDTSIFLFQAWSVRTSWAAASGASASPSWTPDGRNY
jgi:hypothetical protein